METLFSEQYCLHKLVYLAFFFSLQLADSITILK